MINMMALQEAMEVLSNAHNNTVFIVNNILKYEAFISTYIA